MDYQCPQCYGYEIVTVKPRGIFVWVAAVLVAHAAMLFFVFSGAVKNWAMLIVGFTVADVLLTLSWVRGMRFHRYLGATVYRCHACGHTWGETDAPGTVPADVPDFATPANVTARTQSAGDFRMTVQDVFFIKGRGTVVTGNVESGAISVGETIELHSASGIQQTVVEGIEMFRRTLSRADAGDNIGILLRGVSKGDVQRGDVLRGGGW